MVNQNNLYALLPGIIANVTKIIAEEENIPLIEATKKFYKSETYRKLEDFETDFWHLGAAQLWFEYLDEMIALTNESMH